MIKKTLPFILTLLVSAFLYSPHLSFSVSDSTNMLNVSVAMYELGESSIAVKTNLATGETLPVYSKYGLGLPVLLQPFLLLNDMAARVCPALRPEAVLGLFNPLVLALTAEAVFLTVLALGYGFGAGLFLSLLTVFGTFALPYLNFYLTEPAQALFLTAGFYLVLKAGLAGADGARARSGLLYAFCAGAALAMAAFVKAAVIILIPMYLVYLFYALRGSPGGRLARYGAAIAAPLALYFMAQAWLNTAHFGSPLDFGYGAEAAMFVNPVGRGLVDLLYSPSKGLFIFAPVMIIFPYALYRFSRSYRAEAVLIGALFAVNLVFYSAWWAWEGGDTWGPRFLLPLLPLGVVTVAEIIDVKAFKWLAVLLFAAGFAINMLAVLQDPAGFNYVVMRSTEGMEVETTRPRTDYPAPFDRHPPYVVTSTVPEFNVLEGHLWLLRARYAPPGAAGAVYARPPWISRHPGYPPVPRAALPEEIRIRLGCATPVLPSRLFCAERPSAPYYYDALTLQADKARALGLVGHAASLKAKAKRFSGEKLLRARRMRPY